MDAIDRSNPTPVIVKNSIQAAAATGTSATGTFFNVMAVSIPIVASASGSAQTWINPESGTVVAKASYVFLGATGGVGVVDIGRGSDGTGAGSSFIDGGTMALGVVYPQEVVGTVAASATAGGADIMWQLIGPGGSGTNNSINLTHTDGVTGTYSGGAMIIHYYPVGS